MSASKRFAGMGVEQSAVEIDVDSLAGRIEGIVTRMQQTTTQLLQSQGVTILSGTARFTGPNHVAVTTAEGESIIQGDAFIVATGSRPRIPEWVQPDGERILTTRDCYPPKDFPKSIVVIGSGVRAWNSSTCSRRSGLK